VARLEVQVSAALLVLTASLREALLPPLLLFLLLLVGLEALALVLLSLPLVLAL
jgi:hypothetical protein